MNETEARVVTKPQLVAELAELAGISKVKAGRLLDGLAYIACREARKGFVIPGVCKLDVVHRKERLCRNPRTGQMYRIGERDAVRIRPVKKARDLIAPAVDGLVRLVETPPPVPQEASPAPAASADVPAPEAAPTPAAPIAAPLEASAPSPTEAPAPSPAATSASAPAEPEVSFSCKGCGVEILAPASSAGQAATCPACGYALVVPMPAPVVTVPAAAPVAPVPAKSAAQAPAAQPAWGRAFILFSCPECKQDIEAPGSLAGQKGECPSCGVSLTVPRESRKGVARAPAPAEVASAQKTDMKGLMSQTIRIELS